MEETHDKPTIPDHTIPLQGEFDMKNSNNDGGERNMNMYPEKNAADLERDIEKRVIREEIIAAEIRRRELEDEVRRDLMREKQILCMGNFYGFPNVDHTMSTNYGFWGSHYRPNYDEYLGINPHRLGNYEVGSEEKCHIEEGAFGKSTFDRDPSSVTAHVAEKFNEEMVEEVIMSEATASTGIIGVKRKAEMPVRSCDDETTPTMSNDSQKWFCSLCEVSTTSEVTLNSHFQGKKHKSKEARSKANDTPAIIDNSAPSLQPVSIAISEGDNGSVTKKWECSLCQVSATSEIHLISHCQGKKHKAKEAKLQTGEIIAKIEGFPTDKSLELSIVPTSNAIVTTATDTQWYCSLCGVSASSENSLNDHFKGRKHKAKVGLCQEAKVGLCQEELVKEGDTSVEFVKYWHCKMCNKGTCDEATMAAHRKSDEHMTLLKKHGGGLVSVVSIPKQALEAGGISQEELSA